ncbi:MAG: membrane protein insertase YidC [Coriobacteriales bacterium]|nr:membrane protein insertase YidC [Coriobacteriales bacterium]
MDIINTIFGIPLGYILYFCYSVAGSFGLAILLFTVLTKVIIFPFSLMGQKNAITMVRIQPKLEDIKRRFQGNNTLILEEQKKLYRRENYSTIKGALPLLIQIPLILGLINVIYNPLQHLLHIDPQMIQALIAQASLITSIPIEEMGFAAQLKVMELVQADPAAFAMMPQAADAIAQIQSIHTNFLGVNLSENPNLTLPSVLYPILSALSALALSLYQNKYYILQKTASNLNKWGMAVFLVAFSGYFAAVLPCGLGLYWIAGNILSVAVVWLCNIIYNPKKLLDKHSAPQKAVLNREERAQQKSIKALQHAREKADEQRFYEAPDKQLVFYSEGSGFYKYFEQTITWLLENSNITIHYVTNDFDDQVFKRAELVESPRFLSYYIGPTALISFMMRLDAAMVVMTTPDLEQYHIKRSLVRKDIEYVYLDHGFGSLNLELREGALDHFDTVFCYGPNHIEEVRKTEDVYGTPEKRLVKTGYSLYDALISSVEAREQQQSSTARATLVDTAPETSPAVILLAPSWQSDNILETCFDETVTPLLDKGFRVIVRPHPEFSKRLRPKLDELISRWKGKGNGLLSFEVDFSSNKTVYSADLVITDWSTIAQEFSLSTKKPSLFVNTPIKVMNPNWERIGVEPIGFVLRNDLGEDIDTDDLSKVGELAERLINNQADWREQITAFYDEYVFNHGWAAQAAGEYILSSLQLAEYRRQTGKEDSKRQAGDNDRKHRASKSGIKGGSYA